MPETNKFDTTNILVVGTGGQGVMTATEILAEAAIALGHDVKKTEVAGMAQRGGVVSSHLRFGTKVLSPQITPGSADVLLGFEAAASDPEGFLRSQIRPAGAETVSVSVFKSSLASHANRLNLIPSADRLGKHWLPD